MARIFNLLPGRRRRLEQDLDRELGYHVDRRVDELITDGLSEGDARRQAYKEFGGMTQVRDNVHDTFLWGWLDSLMGDVRFAVRSLVASRGFALGTGAVLALAIGTNTAIFSVVHAVLLQPLAYPDAERIVSVQTLWTNEGRLSPDVTGPDFLEWQAQTGLFEAVGHASGEDDLATSVNGQAEFANVRAVSADYFTVFGQPAYVGRLIGPRDTPAPKGRPAAAVVGARWAETHFGTPHAAIGKIIKVYEDTIEIVGVAAPGFRYPDATDIWIPDWATNPVNRNNHKYQVVAKLAPGVTLETARAKVRTVGDRLAKEYPENRFKTGAVIPLKESLTSRVESTLWMLMGAVLLILLIACANIANLLLARFAMKTREIALRSALGAGRGRVVRQLLTEYFVLAATSALVGLLLANVLMYGLTAVMPPNLPRLDEVKIDLTVLLFALGLTVLATLLFGLLPAVQAVRVDLTDTLKQGGAHAAALGGRGRFRSVLVATEVALCVILLVAATLLLRSFQALHGVDLGFATERVLVGYTQYVVANAEDRRLRGEFYRDLLERLRRTPGVTAAAGFAYQPMGREARPAVEYIIEGRPEGQPGERPKAEIQGITPGYFKTLGIPLRLGRDFAASDTMEATPVAIINESMSRTAFPNESPIGRRIKTNPKGSWIEIVGVAGDTRWRDPSRPAPPEVFMASAQGTGGSLSILVRTTNDELAFGQTLRRIVSEMNPSVPVRTEPMQELFATALAYPSFRAKLVGAFAGAAALLAAVGIFGVLAFIVGRRTKEIAVRRAIGAPASSVIFLVLSQGLRPVVIGLTIGLVGSLLGMRVLEGLLYGITPWDVGSYLGAIVVLGIAASLGTLLPAIRAARVGIVRALRND